MAANLMDIDEMLARNPEDLKDIKKKITNENFMESLSRLGKIDDIEERVTNPVLHTLFEARKIDSYYNYLDSYEKGKFIEENKDRIACYQLYNKYTKFYRSENEYDQKLYTGTQDDIIDLYVDKIQTTKWKFFNTTTQEEVKSEIISVELIRGIIGNLLKYGRILIVEDGIITTTTIDQSLLSIGQVNEVINEEKIKLGGIKIYAPHQYNLKKNKILLKSENGGVKEESIPKEKNFLELDVKNGLLDKKTDLVYLLSLFMTNFGIENELGKTKIHADKRYVSEYNKDIYSIYDPILQSQENQPNPLWQFTQASIRPNDHTTAIETIVYLISRSIGLDIRGLVYMTATQDNTVTMEDVIKINNWLSLLEDKINKMLNHFGFKYEIAFEEFTMDTLQTDLTRITNLYQGGLLPVDRAVYEVYKRMNYISEDTKIDSKEFQEIIAKIKIEKGIPGFSSDEIDIMRTLDPEEKETGHLV